MLEEGTTLNRRWELQRRLATSPVDAVFLARELNLESGLPQSDRVVRILPPSADLTQPPYTPDLDLALSPGDLPIAPVRDVGECRGGPAAGSIFLVTDPARHSWLTATVGVSDALGVTAALLTMHEAGHLHGHLKPSNIVLTPNGWALADVGLVPLQPQTMIAWALAKQAVSWLDPAVLRGHVGVATDVWGLGASLLGALTGVPPFPPETGPESVAFGRARLPDALPEPFDLVVRGCLQPDLARRWTLTRVADVLARRLHVPDLASPPGRPSRSAWPRRYRVRLGAHPVCMHLEEERLTVGLAGGELQAFLQDARTWICRLPARPVRIHSGEDLLVASEDGVLHHVDRTTGRIVGSHNPGWGPLVDLAVGPEGRLAAALGPRGLGLGHRTVAVPGGVQQVASSPRGPCTASRDGVVRCWTWEGQPSGSATPHTAPLAGLGTGCSASWDGTVSTWGADLDDVRQVAPPGAAARCLEGEAVGFEDGSLFFLDGRRVVVSPGPVDLVSVWRQRLAVACRGTIDVLDQADLACC